MKVHGRDFQPWSPIWWLDETGGGIPFFVAFSGIAICASFLFDSFVGHRIGPLLGVVMVFVLLVSMPAVLIFAGIVTLIFGIPGKPSDGVVGQQVFLIPATQAHFSGGHLLVTTEVLAFVPGASRRTGTYGKWEYETVVPLRELQAVELWWVWGFLPFGITITRTSGDRERLTVGRPHYVIREIAKAHEAWRVAVAAQL